MKIINKLLEYYKTHQTRKKLINKKAAVKKHKQALEILSLQIGILEEKIAQKLYKPSSIDFLFLKEEIADIYEKLSLLSQNIQDEYIESIENLQDLIKILETSDASSFNYNNTFKNSQIAQYIYECYLVSIIDARSLFEKVRYIMSEAKIDYDDKIYKELSTLIRNTFLQIDNYQNTTLIQILHNVATAPTFEDAWNLYKKSQVLLSEFVIIKQNKSKDINWAPIDLFAILPSKSKPNYPIYSFFGDNKVNMISYRILLSPYNISINERSISFDTNIISYFKSITEKGKTAVDFSPILEFLSAPKAQYDYSPFLMENYISGNYNDEQLTKEIDNIEKDLSINRFYPYRPGYAKQLVNMYKNPNFTKPLESIYKRLYLYLLIIVWIKLKYPQYSAKKQFEKLCEIMTTELNDCPLPEMAMAYDYYHNSENTIDFFKKIQRNQKNLTKSIKNMSWDLFHITIAIKSCIVKQPESNVLIPYFATYDKGLAKILSYYELEALAICYRTQEYFPYYSIKNIPLELRKKYFSHSIKRIPVDIDALVDKYEDLLNNL